MTEKVRKKRRRGRPETRVIKLDAAMEEVAQRISCEREETGPVDTDTEQRGGRKRMSGTPREAAARHEEIERNYEYFNEVLPTLLEAHENQFVVIHDRSIARICDTGEDAMAVADSLYGREGLYSIQEITDKPVSFGWYSYASSVGQSK